MILSSTTVKVLAVAAFSLLFSELTGQDVTCISFIYDDSNRVIEEHVAGNTDVIIHKYWYDSNGQKVKSESIDSATGQIVDKTSITEEIINGAVYRKETHISCRDTTKKFTRTYYKRFADNGLLLCDSFADHNFWIIYRYSDTILIGQTSISARNPEGISKTTYSYDNNGRLTRKTENVAGFVRYIEYNYNRQGQLINETEYVVPQLRRPQKVGVIASYEYSKEGLLIKKTYTGKGELLMEPPSVIEYAYDSAGRLTSLCTTILNSDD